MSLYGDCIRQDGQDATHAVVMKPGNFAPANDRFGEDRMTVAIRDIVFCRSCAEEFATEANLDSDVCGERCDACDGPARFQVEGNAHGIKCVGHVQQYLREPASAFYSVTSLGAQPTTSRTRSSTV